MATATRQTLPTWTITFDDHQRVMSVGSCGWSHIGGDRNLATIARVDHELRHRRGLAHGPHSQVTDHMGPGLNDIRSVLGALCEQGLTTEGAVAAVHEAIAADAVRLTPDFKLVRVNA